MKEYEYLKYEKAEWYLHELKRVHAAELYEAYDGIHPTRTAVNYDLGEMYVESVNPFEYAVYLIEMQEVHKQKEQYWADLAAVFKQATRKLSKQELNKLNNPLESRKIKEKVKQNLMQIIQSRPQIHRGASEIDDIENVDEYDKKIENMSEAELLDGYVDLLEGVGSIWRT